MDSAGLQDLDATLASLFSIDGSTGVMTYSPSITGISRFTFMRRLNQGLRQAEKSRSHQSSTWTFSLFIRTASFTTVIAWHNRKSCSPTKHMSSTTSASLQRKKMCQKALWMLKIQLETWCSCRHVHPSVQLTKISIRLQLKCSRYREISANCQKICHFQPSSTLHKACHSPTSSFISLTTTWKST